MIKAVINETETKKTVAKIIETKIWFFDKISKISKTLANSSNKKGRGLKSIKSEMHNTEIQTRLRVLKATVYQQKTIAWHGRNGQSLRNVQSPKTEPEKKKKENIDKPITSTEIEIVIKNPPTNKSSEPWWLHRQILSKFKESTPIFLKLFQKLQRKEYSEAHYTRRPSSWYQNQKKDITKKNIIGQYQW